MNNFLGVYSLYLVCLESHGVTKRKGVLPTTQNYRTPDADLSDPDLLFYLQTSELNNTW